MSETKLTGDDDRLLGKALMASTTTQYEIEVAPWPLDWNGKPIPFAKLTHAERRRLMQAKRVSVPAALSSEGK